MIVGTWHDASLRKTKRHKSVCIIASQSQRPDLLSFGFCNVNVEMLYCCVSIFLFI